MEQLKIGWFSTGRDKAARQLLDTVQKKIEAREIKAKILFVFCNRRHDESPETSELFSLAGSHHLTVISYSSKEFISLRCYKKNSEYSRIERDREIMTLLGKFEPDICVLAGYMLIVSGEMCRYYKMINLHPALPGGPKGSWQEVIWQLIRKRATETGVMMHLVTPELDSGPVVTYCKFPVRGKPFDRLWGKIKGKPLDEIKSREGENNKLFKLIRQQGLVREFPLIIATIKAFSEGRVMIKEGKVVDQKGEVTHGYDLTEEIEAEIKESKRGK